MSENTKIFVLNKQLLAGIKSLAAFPTVFTYALKSIMSTERRDDVKSVAIIGAGPSGIATAK